MAIVVSRVPRAPVWGLAALAFGAGCATMLPTLPPSALYGSAEAPAADLSPQQRELVDRINAGLSTAGLPAATPGAFEMNAAAVIADAAFTKHGAGTNAVSRGTNLSGAIDEGEGTESKIHVEQRLLADGLTTDLSTFYAIEDFPQHDLTPEEIAQAVQALSPAYVRGKLRIGVAIVANGWDNHRIFALTLRDEAIDLTRGPPRKAEPSTSFTLSGTLLFHPDPAQLELAVQRPDGTVDLRQLPVAADGAFSATYQLPADPGLYVLSLGHTILQLPVFAGVTPSPWPASAPADAEAPETAVAAAKALAKAVEGWRKQRGLPPLPLTSDLCALAKASAKGFSVAKQVGKGEKKAFGSATERFAAAGLDPKHSWELRTMISADDFGDWAARVPWNPLAAQALGAANVSALGVGVVKEPQRSPDDKAFFDFALITTQGAAKAAPAPSASR